MGAAGRSYKWVIDTQHMVSSMAMKEIRPPSCWVSPDSLTYTVGDGSLQMDHFRKAIATLRADAWDCYDDLVGPGKRFVTIHHSALVDDLTDSTRGHSFASREPFASHQLECFYHVVELHKLAEVDIHGRIAWNIPKINRFLDKSAKYWRLLGYLIGLTAQISIRGQQFLEHTFVNTDRMRSFIWPGGEGLVMGGYSKTSHLTEQDGYIPAFLHDMASELLVESYGGGLRITESHLVFVVTDDLTMAEVHRTLVISSVPLHATLTHLPPKIFLQRARRPNHHPGVVPSTQVLERGVPGGQLGCAALKTCHDRHVSGAHTP